MRERVGFITLQEYSQLTGIHRRPVILRVVPSHP